MPDNQYFIYILASKRGGTLYIGVTSDLVKRVYQHKKDQADGFAKKYQLHDPVYYETTNDVQAAIAGEKHLKTWQRAWKIRLIEERNPPWLDLYPEIIG